LPIDTGLTYFEVLLNAPTPGSGKPFEARWYEGTQGVDKKASGVVAIKVLSLLNFQP
jgi:hypothetical protein